MPAVFPGFLWAIVENNNDPLKIGRVKLSIPGVYNTPQTHPEWAHVAGAPGSGNPRSGYGSRPPVAIGTHGIAIGEAGRIDAPLVFLPVTSGAAENGTPLGPSETADADDPNTVYPIWEDDRLAFFLTTGDDRNANEDDRRFEIKDKLTGSGITLNLTDGAQGKSVTMEIFANTSLNIKSNGVVNIEGTVVQIQGRRVIKNPSNSSI